MCLTFWGQIKIGVEGDFHFDFSVNGGIGAGFRKVLNIEGGIEGSAENTLQFPFKSLNQSFTSNLAAKVYLARSILGYDEKISKTFAEYQLYPRKESKAKSADAANETMLMNLDDSSGLKITPRDYLENDVSLFAADSSSEYEVLKTNVYPYTDVQTVTLADGRKLSVWSDDDTTRDLYNKTALYYSVYANGEWSAAKRIDNDQTADFDFSLAVCGNKAAVLYQNMTETVIESDTAESSALKTDLAYAEFDGDKWGEPIAIKDENSDYEYHPELCLGENAAHIMWVQNSGNTPFPAIAGALESVYTATVTDGVVGTIVSEANNLGFITSAVITETERIYVSDNDNDISTVGATVYINGEVLYESEYDISSFIRRNNSLYFNENGSLRFLNTDNGLTHALLEGDYKDARVIDETTLIFEKSNGMTSELWKVSSYDKIPVPLVQLDKRIRSWDVSATDDGNFEFTIAAAQITPTADSFSQNVSILHIGNASDSSSTAVDAALIALETTDVKQGQTATFNIGVLNNSYRDIGYAPVRLVIQAGATELYGDSQTLNLSAGEMSTITVGVPIPKDFSKQEVTASIQFETGEYSGNFTDTNLENNVISTEIGQADLSILAQAVPTDGEALLTVENIGCEDAKNVIVTLKTNGGTQVYRNNIGDLAIGQHQTLHVTIPQEYYTFSNQYDKTVFTAEVSSDNEEPIDYNNVASCTFQNVERHVIQLSKQSVNLMPEQQFTPTVTVSPSSDNVEFYCFSSDETVATVDENGTVTAVGIGTANVTYSTNNALCPGVLAVTVSETIEIPETSAEFFEYYSNSDGIVITGFAEDDFEDTDVRIPDEIDEKNVVGIYYNAFSDCTKIETVTLGKNISFVRSGAFAYMSACTQIYVDEENQFFSSENGNLYNKDKTRLVSYANGKTDKSFEIPSGVTSIEAYAMSGSGLESVTIPATVTELESQALSGMLSLKTVSAAEDSAHFCSVDGVLFNKDKSTLYAYPAAKQGSKYTVLSGVTTVFDSAFYGCKHLKEVILPSSVTDIGQFAFFNCNSMRKIALPSGISQIKRYAFAYCRALERVILPETVTNVAEYAFFENTSLKNVLFDGTQEAWNRITVEKENDAFANAKLHFRFTVTDASEGGTTIAVTPVNIEKGNTVILALYRNNKLIETQTKVYDGTAVTFVPKEAYTETRIMVWSNFNDLKPICVEDATIHNEY